MYLCYPCDQVLPATEASRYPDYGIQDFPCLSNVPHKLCGKKVKPETVINIQESLKNICSSITRKGKDCCWIDSLLFI